jgi:hypothetical protein
MPMTALKFENPGDAAAARLASGWDDLLLLEDQLTEEERLVRDTARGYSQDKMIPLYSVAIIPEPRGDCP